MSDDIVQNVTEKQRFVSKEIEPGMDGHTMQHFVDPFADNIDSPFFATADIRTKLDEVVHLCQFGGNVVTLLGDKGVGKTTFLAEARQELSETSFCCIIDSALMMSADDIFKQIIAQLGLAVAPLSTTGEMLAVLRRAMSDSSLHRVVIVIDDADFLNEAIVSGLLSLFQGAQGGQFHLLLSGNKNLIQRLDNLDIVDVLIYDISLDPLSFEEAKDYIDFKLGLVGKNTDNHFKQGEIDSIYKQARGFPAEINKAAQKLLLSNDSLGDLATLDVEHKTGLPLLHMGLLILLLAALIMLLIYMGDDSPSESKPVSVETLGPPIVKEAEPDAIDLAIAKLNAEKERAQEQSAQQPAQVSTDIAKEAVEIPTKDSNKKLDQIAQQSQPVAEEVKKPVDNEAQKANDLKEELQKELERESALLKAQSNNNKAETKTSAVAIADLNEKFSGDEKAVLAWSDTAFTIQIIGAEQKDSLVKYIASQPNASKLLLVSLTRNGKPWHVVVTGVYETAQLARQAIQSLPQNQVNGGPWPKKVSDLKRDIRSFRRI